MHLSPLEDKRITISLTHALDAEQAPTFRNLVKQALDHKPLTLAINMKDLTYIDSTGIGMLVLANTDAKRVGCEVRLTNLGTGHPRKVLELMRCDQIFPIEYATE